MRLGNVLDFNQFEALNMRLQNLGAAPSSPVDGQIYFDTVLDTPRIYSVALGDWINVGDAMSAADILAALVTVDGAGSGLDADLVDGLSSAALLARANHTGTQAPSTIQVSATDRILGRDTAAAGPAEELTVGGGLEFTGTGIQTSARTGDVTKAAGGTVNTIANDVVTNAKAANMAQNTIKGRVTAGTGDPEDLTAAQAKTVLAIVPGDVTGFDTQVRTSRLDQMAAPTADVNLNSRKVTNLGTPTADTDAATKAYADSLANGLDVKASVRVRTTTNVNLSAPGATLDGVAMAAGNRFLATGQTTTADNGIYVWNGAATPATRAADADSSAEVTSGMFTFVEEGTGADQGWTLTTNNPITLGTTGLAFTQFSGAGQITAGAGMTKTGDTLDVVAGQGLTANADSIQVTNLGITTGMIANDAIDATKIAPDAVGNSELAPNAVTDAEVAAGAAIDVSKINGAMRRYATTIGDGAATLFTITHNLGTRDVQVQVYDAADPWDDIFVGAERTTINTVTVRFGAAPATNSRRVVVIG